MATSFDHISDTRPDKISWQTRSSDKFNISSLRIFPWDEFTRKVVLAWVIFWLSLVIPIILLWNEIEEIKVEKGVHKQNDIFGKGTGKLSFEEIEASTAKNGYETHPISGDYAIKKERNFEEIESLMERKLHIFKAEWEKCTCPGEAGPIGPPGAPGVFLKGDNGDTGGVGLNGSDGSKGDPGLAGQKGDNGWPGRDGMNGIKGVQGEKGLPGVPGYPGEKGESGQFFG